MGKEVKNNENSVKRERFVRLATLRTNAVIQRLRILGNCANRYLYEYNEEDVKKIFNAIRAVLNEVEKKFYVPKENKFKLE